MVQRDPDNRGAAIAIYTLIAATIGALVWMVARMRKKPDQTRPPKP